MATRPSSLTLSIAAASMALGGLSLMASAALLALQSPEAPPALAGQVAVAPASCEQRCALPEGISLASLSAEGADYIARRAQLCADLECSRIDATTYSEAIDLLDAEPVTPLAERLWATSVREVSSQYGEDDWSAQQALGPADVYPSGGDDVKAWASLSPTGKGEFIEVALPTSRISAVEVYETFNPGAIQSIDIIAADGSRSRVFGGEPRSRGTESHIERVDFSCSKDPIVAVRVTLNATLVPGWNEIDAIAVRPCR